MDNFWIIPILAFALVIPLNIIGADVRANTPEREIIPEMPPPPKKVSDKNPYIEYCDPTTEFYPIKLIENKTHAFNHQFCVWELK